MRQYRGSRLARAQSVLNVTIRWCSVSGKILYERDLLEPRYCRMAHCVVSRDACGQSAFDPKRTLISRVGRFNYRLMFAVVMIGAQRAISSLTNILSACWPRLAFSGM